MDNSTHPPLARQVERLAQDDPDSRETETTFWESVKDSGDEDLIEAYLQSFPDGRFAAEAIAKLAEMRGVHEAPSHPFVGKWRSQNGDCRHEHQAQLGSLERLLIFGPDRTARYISKFRTYQCRATAIIKSKGAFEFAGECKEVYSLSGGAALTGRIVFRGDEKALLGHGPPGLKIRLLPCAKK